MDARKSDDCTTSCRIGVTHLRLMVAREDGDHSSAPSGARCIKAENESVEQDLSKAVAECERTGRSSLVVALADPLPGSTVESVRRISRSAALNAKRLREIRIEVPDIESYERLRLSLGLPGTSRAARWSSGS